MSPDRDPLQRPGTSAGRLLAVGTAAAVTLLTMAGLVGIGPGAQAEVSRSSTAGNTDSTAGQPATKPPAPAGFDDTGQQDGNGWLTIKDDPPAHADRPDTTLPSGSGSGMRIVYDISAQRVWLVDSQDTVQRTYLVSGGRDPSLLDPGLYHVTSMSRNAQSYNYKETMQYMVRFATGDHAPIGFHDVPARPDGSLVETRAELGTPLSSGCIRQWVTDARALWEFASVDTPVVVTA